MKLKIILCGLGGQGVVFLTRLLAKSAVALGYPVLFSETHGMSQRGGSVISHLKIGDNLAPLIMRGTADLLYALEMDEAVRNLDLLRQGGVIFVNAENGLRSEITRETERLSFDIHSLPASQIAVELGAAAVANVVLAGFSAAHPAVPLPIETLRETLEEIVKRGLETNLKALETGYQAGINSHHATL